VLTVVTIKTTWVGGSPWQGTPSKPTKKVKAPAPSPKLKKPGGKSGGNGGFAAMSFEQRSRISSMGGKAVHKAGNAHTFNSETAKEAGLKSTRNRGKRK
jgi:hypothetical protein